MLTTSFIGILLILLFASTGNSFPLLNFPPETCLQETDASKCNSNSGSIFCNEPGVDNFINTFIQAVEDSDILQEVFDLSCATPLEYSRFVYKYNLELYKKRGFKNAASIAEFTARGIPNFKVLTMPLMVRILHNTAANFLFVEGILTLECAESLALKYAEIIENYARENLTEDPTSKFKILADTFFEFVLAVDGNLKTIYPITSYYFGNEFFVALVDIEWKGMIY